MADQAVPVRVIVWDENPPHAPKSIYPKSVNGAIAEGIARFGKKDVEVTTANLDDPEQGVSEAALNAADVLVWWGHARHHEVGDEAVRRIVRRVRNKGMGFVAVHSAHYAKPFRAILRAPGHLKGGWRVTDPPEQMVVRVCAPWHPIARGIKDFTLEHEEMYGAPFDVPPPLAMLFQAHFPLDGKTFPAGLCWTVGKGIDRAFTSGPGAGVGQGEGIGRVFYFQPGHETIPNLYNETVQHILANAVLWCARRI